MIGALQGVSLYEIGSVLRHRSIETTAYYYAKVDVGLLKRVAHGKGRKERVLPLLKETAAALRAWLAVRGDPPVPEVFVNARGRQLSRWGVAHILEKHVQAASEQYPSLLEKRVRVFRRGTTMRVLRATSPGCVESVQHADW